MACGFKIDTKIYSIGGIDQHGEILDLFWEVDYEAKTSKAPIVDKGL
jgi:hypothetical protein